jgi:WD40 repeat protein
MLKNFSSEAPFQEPNSVPTFTGLPRLSNLVDLVFGYDYFVSYAHADGKTYPSRLAEALSQKYNVFLDEWQHRLGDDLNQATRRRVRMASHLIVVFGPKTSMSNWVYEEVKIAHEAGQQIVVIDLDGAYENVDPGNKFRVLLENRIRRSETIVDGSAPSPNLLQTLERDFKGERQDRRRLRFFRGAFAIVFALLIAAVISAVLAHRRAIEIKDRILVFAANQALEAGDSPRAAAFLREVRRERLIPQWRSLAAQITTKPLPLWQSDERLIGTNFSSGSFVTVDDSAILRLRPLADPWSSYSLTGSPSLTPRNLREAGKIPWRAWGSKQLVNVQFHKGSAIWSLGDLTRPLWTADEICPSPDGRFAVLLVGTEARLITSSTKQVLSSADLHDSSMRCEWTQAGPLVGAYEGKPPTYLLPIHATNQKPTTVPPIFFSGVLYEDVFAPSEGSWIAYIKVEAPPISRTLMVVRAGAPSTTILRIPLQLGQEVLRAPKGERQSAILLVDKESLEFIEVRGDIPSIVRRNLPEDLHSADDVLCEWSPDGRRAFVYDRYRWSGAVINFDQPSDILLPAIYLLPEGFLQKVMSSEVKEVSWFGSSGRLVIIANDDKAWLWDLEGNPDALIPFVKNYSEMAPVTGIIGIKGEQIVAKVRGFQGVAIWRYESLVHELNEPEWFDHSGDQFDLKGAIVGNFLITKNDQSGTRLWRLKCSVYDVERPRLQDGRLLSDSVSALVYHPKGQILAAQRTLEIFQFSAGEKILGSFDIPSSADSFVLTPSQNRLFVSDYSGILSVYNILNKALVKVVAQLGEKSNRAIVSSDGHWVLLANNQARLWSSDKVGQKGEVLAEQGVRAGVFSADGAQLLLVKQASGRAVKFEQWLLSSGAPKRGRTWILSDPLPISWPRRNALALARLESGMVLAVADKTGFYLFNLNEHLAWRELPRPEQLLRLAFDPEGVRILGISGHGLFLWDLQESGNAPLALINVDRLRDARFMSGAEKIELLTGDGEVRIIDLSWAGLRQRLESARQLCATPKARRQYLLETQEEAVAAWYDCINKNNKWYILLGGLPL